MAEQDENEVIEEEEEECPKCPPVGAPAWMATFADICLLYTSPSPRDRQKSRMPSSA